MKKLFLLAFAVLPLSAVLAAEPELPEKAWTLEDCLEYGLQSHPRVKMAQSDVDISEAALLSTKSTYDPKVSFSSSLRHSKTERTGNNTDGNSSDSRSESLSLSQKVYDFGITDLKKKQSRESLKASRAEYETTMTELASNIKSAFFKAQQAKSLLKVRLETLESYEKHLNKVKSFVEVGTHAPYDITKAQYDVANARVALISAKSTLKEALVTMANAIGTDKPITLAAYEREALPDIDETKKAEFVEIALQRPDVKASMSQLKSAEYRLQENRKSHTPELSSSAGYSWSGNGSPRDHGWNVGLGLSWSIYDGGTTKASINSAKGSLNRAEASLENLKLTVDSEVENAINTMVDALQRVSANEILVQQASESLDLAEGRYDAGLGSPLEISDARVEYASARGNLIVAYFDSLIAQATLDKVLGRMPKEYTIKEIEDEGR